MLKRTLGILLAACMVLALFTTGVSAAPADELTLKSVTVISDTQLVVEFSQPIELLGPGYAAWQIQYFYPYGALGNRFGFAAEYVSTDKTKVVCTLGPNQDGGATTISQIVNMEGSLSAWAGAGALAKFVVLETSASDDGNVGDVIVAGTGASPVYLKSDGIWDDGKDCARIDSEDFIYNENYQHPTITEDDFRVTEAVAISDTELLARFSEKIEVLSPWTVTYALRYVDADNNTLKADDTTTDLAFMMSAAVTADGQGLLLTLSGAQPHDVDSVLDIVNKTGDLAQYTDAVVKFSIHEVLDNGDSECGTIEKIRGLTSGKLLAANKMDLNGPDGVFVDVTVDTDVILLPEITEGFRLVSATAINNSVVVLEFSEKFTMVEPWAYIAIRYVDSAGNLQYDGQTPLQFNGQSTVAQDGKRIIWTIEKNGNNPGGSPSVMDIINQTGDLAQYSGYRVMFCIQEILTGTDPNDGTIEHITNAAGDKLQANKIGAGDEPDGMYLPISIDRAYPANPLTMPEGFHITKVVAIDEKTIVFEFSEPAEFIAPYAFNAIRYVDIDNNLQWKGELPLQFYGATEVSKDGKSAVWTLADSGNIGNPTSVFDIINRTGSLAEYEDMFVVFCVEEIFDNGKDDEDGTINTIRSKATGKKLVANLIGPGEQYDRVYLPIEIDTDYKNPITADMNPALIAGLLAAAVCAGTVLTVMRKKRVSH